MRHLPFGLIVLACLLMLGRPLLFPDLVLLPADLVKHTVRFEFRPLSFRIGLVISVLAWLFGLGLFVVKRIN